MKLKYLSASIAVALMGGAAQAAPLMPADATGTVYFGGATASSGFIKNSIIDRTCVGTATREITVYQVDADDYTVICDLDPATGATGTMMAIKQGGGSGDGTVPVSDPLNNAILFPVPPANPASVCAAPVTAQTGQGTVYTFYNNCLIGNTQVQGADIGASDVEPGLFYDVNTPSTGNPFPPSDLSKLTVRPLASLVFGVAATESLRDALQAMQFTSSSPCNPGNANHDLLMPQTIAGITYDVGRIAAGTANATADASPSLGTATVGDSEQCMPNMSRAEIAGVFTGGITNWTQIKQGNTNLVQAALSAGVPVPDAAAPLNNQRVHICRRSTGSGTNAQFQAYYLRRPCAKDITGTPVAQAMLGPVTAAAANFNGDQVVLANRGSSDLGRCLDDLQTGLKSSTSTYFKPGGFPTDDPRFAWGMGYQSAEKNQSLSRGWRFIKVDGFAPTLQNAYRADYLNVAEATCQINNADVGPGDFIMAQAIVEEVCAADTISVFNEDQNFLHAFGQSGWLAVPDDDKHGNSTAVPEAPALPSDLMNPNGPVPVSSWTRGGNNCSVAKVIDDVEI